MLLIVPLAVSCNKSPGTITQDLKQNYCFPSALWAHDVYATVACMHVFFHTVLLLPTLSFYTKFDFDNLPSIIQGKLKMVGYI